MSTYDYQGPEQDPEYGSALDPEPDLELVVTTLDPVQLALIDTVRRGELLATQFDILVVEIQRLVAERHRISDILSTFADAEISLATLQPVLALARELRRA